MRSCPDCKRRISYSASTCPLCGCDIEKIREELVEEREAYCRMHGIDISDLRGYYKSLGYDVATWDGDGSKDYVGKDTTSQAYHKKMQAQKNKEKQKKSKEIAKKKEKDKKALLKRIEKENAKRAAKDKKDAAEQKQEQAQKANEKQERVKQRRFLIKKGEPEIDYDELIDMKKSENQFFIIFFSSIVSFFILHWLISVSVICYAIFI
ncbi:MAG: hypothetical protein ACKVG7_05910, partial [Flavobacteriales bacterium]